MKTVWIIVAVLSAITCGVLGFLLANRKPVYPVPVHRPASDEDDVIEEFLKVDPKWIIGKEVARLATGLKELRGLAVGPDDRVTVVGDKALILLGKDGQPDRRTELDKAPTCVAVGPDSLAYVSLMDHVEVFDPKGVRKAIWENPGPKSWITSIAIGEDEVYLADFSERRIIRYDKNGQLRGRLAPEGADRNFTRFEVPSPYFDVAVDPSGSLWVAHVGKRLLENYKSDGSLANVWGRSGPQIECFSGCCNPSHIAIRKDGSFITSEKGLVRVKLYKPSGELIGVIAAAKDFEKGIHGLVLAVDSKDRILVADPGTSTVRIYEERAPESHP